MTLRTIPLFLVPLLCTAALTAPREARSVAVGAACPTSYADGLDLQDQFTRAVSDIRSCAAAGRISPQVGRRVLSRVASLRDMSDYDRRRARGTLSARRERQFEYRLRLVMASIRH